MHHSKCLVPTFGRNLQYFMLESISEGVFWGTSRWKGFGRSFDGVIIVNVTECTYISGSVDRSYSKRYKLKSFNIPVKIRIKIRRFVVRWRSEALVSSDSAGRSSLPGRRLFVPSWSSISSQSSVFFESSAVWNSFGRHFPSSYFVYWRVSILW